MSLIKVTQAILNFTFANCTPQCCKYRMLFLQEVPIQNQLSQSNNIFPCYQGNKDNMQ
jgi:hypothetical protein